MHRLALTPDAGKVWVVTPPGTIALSRESVEDAFSQAVEEDLYTSTGAAIQSARATAETAAYDGSIDVAKQRGLMAIQVEEAKANQHYDEVLANIHLLDSIEVIAATLKSETARETARYQAALRELDMQKQLAIADTFEEKLAIMSAAEKQATEHIVANVLQLLTAAVAKQQAYENVRSDMGRVALAAEDRQAREAKEFHLYEVGEITRSQDSAIRCVQNHTSGNAFCGLRFVLFGYTIPHVTTRVRQFARARISPCYDVIRANRGAGRKAYGCSLPGCGRVAACRDTDAGFSG